MAIFYHQVVFSEYPAPQQSGSPSCLSEGTLLRNTECGLGAWMCTQEAAVRRGHVLEGLWYGICRHQSFFVTHKPFTQADLEKIPGVELLCGLRTPQCDRATTTTNKIYQIWVQVSTKQPKQDFVAWGLSIVSCSQNSNNNCSKTSKTQLAGRHHEIS